MFTRIAKMCLWMFIAGFSFCNAMDEKDCPLFGELPLAISYWPDIEASNFLNNVCEEGIYFYDEDEKEKSVISHQALDKGVFFGLGVVCGMGIATFLKIKSK